MQNLSLKNKCIVVTGGCGLLGKEFIKAIAENEGTAIIADLNEDSGKKLEVQFKNEIKTGQIEFIPLNIISKKSIQSAIQILHKKYGKIDVLVNSAYPRNKNWGHKFEEVTYEDLCENINMHLGGYFLTSQQFSEYFKKNGGGNLINFSSIYGVIAPRFEVYKDTPMTLPIEYPLIKSAIILLTKYIAKYYKGYHIRANCISPGGILDQQPETFQKQYKTYCLNKGMLDRQDMVGTLLFLLSDASKMINGQNLIVDDGFTL